MLIDIHGQQWTSWNSSSAITRPAKFRMNSILWGSILCPCWKMIRPHHRTSVLWKLYFFADKNSLCLALRKKLFSKSASASSRVFACKIKSSFHDWNAFLMHANRGGTVDWTYNEEFFKPCNSRVDMKKPCVATISQAPYDFCWEHWLLGIMHQS